MTDLARLEAFLWIARLGTFRAAAERLNLTQPSITARIRTLEAELGVVLFERSGRTMRLTADGRRLVDYAERLTGLAGDLHAAFAGRRGATGVLRLGVVETIAHTWLPAVIKGFNAAHPGVTLELDVDTTVGLRAALVERRIDAAFLMGPVSEPSIDNRPLARYPLAWIASPGLDLPDRPLDPAEIARVPVVTYSRHSRPYLQIRALLDGGGEGPRPRLHACSSLATIVRLTLNGFGVSAIPPRIVADELDRGTLVELSSPVPLPDLYFTASRPHGPGDPAVDALIALALDAAAADGAAPPDGDR